jgi:hypothetical protein
MVVAWNKDQWIKLALVRGYLFVNKSGSIARTRATAQGFIVPGASFAKIKVQTHKKTGRVYFNLTFMGITKSVLVNRVVALRFLPNPLNLPVVNHIDGVKANNALLNLEWSTNSDNEKHAHQTGLKTGRGSSNSNAKLTALDVIDIRASDENADALALHYGVARSTITNVIKRRTWSHV